MAIQTNQVIDTFRRLCENCSHQEETPLMLDGHKFVARTLSAKETQGALYGMYDMAQTLQGGYVDIIRDANNGVKWTHEEIVPASVRSRHDNGGLGMYNCFHDPSKVQRIFKTKTAHLERMYIHGQYCMRKMINGKFPRNESFTDSATGMRMAASMDYATYLMTVNYISFAKEIDGNNIFGNAQHTNDQSIDGVSSTFYRWDGWLKLMIQANDEIYYPVVDVEIPELDGGAYFVKKGGYSQVALSKEELINVLSELSGNIDGDKFYSVSETELNTIRIVGNNPRMRIYGDDLLQIYYAPTGNIAACDKPLQGIQIQAPMPYFEQPCLMPYEPINDGNFYPYFQEAVRTIHDKLSELSADSDYSSILEGREQFIYIDPNILSTKAYADYAELCKCDNADEILSRRNAMFPTFVPLKCLQGKGLWLWSVSGNLTYLTNEQASVPQIASGYEAKCEEVWTKMEMFGGCAIMDLNLTASNVLGHPFAENLTPPQVPENNPHLCPEVQANCVSCPTDVTSVSATAKWVTVEEDVDYTLELIADVNLADEDTATVYNWKVITVNGIDETSSIEPIAEVTGLASDYIDTIQTIILEVVFASGNTIDYTLPYTAITV